jgi:hypothetical protein
MAPTKSPLNDEGYWSSEERPLPPAKRQKTEHVTSAPPLDSITEPQIAELWDCLSGLTLDDPPPPPPTLIITDETDTPVVVERRIARARRIGNDANLAEIDRIAGEQDVYFHLKPPRAWPQRLSPLWQSNNGKVFQFKKPDWFHPFLNRLNDRTRRDERYRHL